MGFDESGGLRQDEGAERLAVAIDQSDALALQFLQRLTGGLQPVRARIKRGLARGVEEAIAQLRVHPLVRDVAEEQSERGKDVLGQRVEFGGLVELAGED